MANKQFDTIATHQVPHLDEVVAIWLLQKFGEKIFPGVNTAKLVFWNSGATPDSRTAEEYEEDGVFLLGVGGGRFDEHPTASEARKEGCCATLVAKALGVDEEPALAQILKYVATEDARGGGQLFDLAAIVKLLNQQFPDKPERVIEWTTTALEAKLKEQKQFSSIAPEEWERMATIEKIDGPHGKTFVMTTVVSDNPQAAKYARSKQGGGADIVIVRQSTGHTQIFTTKRAGLKIHDVVQIIRFAEQKAKGRVLTTDWGTLASEGKVGGAEEWFYHLKGQMLLNGSLTATGVPPTKLSLAEIQEAVRIGLNPEAFAPERSSNCVMGVCTSTRGNECPWYRWGLHRCRLIRFEMSKRR